jgi:hypothetical protein
MSRQSVRILKIIMIITFLVFFQANLVSARFIVRDNTAVDPVMVCKDGIYLGVAKQGEDSPDTLEVTVLPELQPNGEVLFEAGDEIFEVPPNPIEEDSLFTHSAYFTRLWKASFQPLSPGSLIILSGGSTDPTVTVQDCLVVPEETPADSSITYQGNLLDEEAPADGDYDFRFKLYNADTGGDQVGRTIVKADLTVSDGVFTTELNFGSGAFNGGARWLEVAVRPGSSTGGYTILSPRQPLTATPYALNVLNVPDHDHLGQTWIGNYTPLGIEGSYSEAPLVLNNLNNEQGESAGGNGLFANSDWPSGSGVYGKATSQSGRGVYGVADSTTGFTYGVQGRSASNLGTGVYGYASSFTGSNYGVRGESSSNSGTGVYGRASSSSGSTYGVRGESFSEFGVGVYGEHAATTGVSPGIEGFTNSTSTGALAILGEAENGRGVFGMSHTGIGTYGYASSSTGVNYGIVGWTWSGDGYGGYFNGKVHVNGNFSASGTKSFKIDHPLDPANQYLYHYAIESPQVQNVYNGVVTLDDNGAAVVPLPDYFEALNTGEFTYQLTPIGASMPNLYVSQEIQGNIFEIGGGEPNMKVSWSVTGVRNDPYMQANQLSDESPKPEAERGTYLFPQGYGQPESLGLDNNLINPYQDAAP